MENYSCCRCFVDEKLLSEQQRAVLALGVAGVEALLAAFDADEFWRRAGEDPLYRCILVALGLRDTLHNIGRTDAEVVRTGMDLRQLAGGYNFSLTVGHPASPRLERHWPAHMTVRLGDFLLDPTHGQTKRFWNNSPKAAAFRIGTSGVDTISIWPGTPAKVMTLHQYQDGNRLYQVTYFKLPRAMDLRTRKWRNAPDARPERGQPIVQAASAILLSRLEAERRAA